MAKQKLFLDTNIIIDLLADRKPFSNAAYVIFREANIGRCEIYTSTNSILTTFYILEREIGLRQANKAIETILDRIEVQDITKKELIQAINSKTDDLADASQIECANKIKEIDFIITRDKKGFTYSILEVLSSDEFVETKLKK